MNEVLNAVERKNDFGLSLKDSEIGGNEKKEVQDFNKIIVLSKLIEENVTEVCKNIIKSLRNQTHIL